MLVVAAVALVLLFALLAKGCEAIEGGPVRTTDEFRAHVQATTETGTRVYLALSPVPTGDPHPSQENGGSCVDDFGWDQGNVTRDQPTYAWDLEYASTADFRAALRALEATWREEGREVEKVENGITTALDDGIRVTLHLGWYTGKPELRAEGRCMRYTDDYRDAYQYTSDANGDGTVDEYERPAY